MSQATHQVLNAANRESIQYGPGQAAIGNQLELQSVSEANSVMCTSPPRASTRASRRKVATAAKTGMNQ